MSISINIENSFDVSNVNSNVFIPKSCIEKTITVEKCSNSNMINQLRLRFLSARDIEELKVLCNDWFPIKYPDSWFNLVAIDDRFYSLAATLEHKIIAILIAEIKPRWQVSKEDSDLLAASFDKDSQVAYILSLGVHKEFRRQGIASHLLHTFITSTCTQDKLSCKEVKAIYLHVLSTNTPAIQFYEQHKFKMLHFLPAYYMIDGIAKDGYSYVLHINGGTPPITFLDYIVKTLSFMSVFQFFSLPSRLFVYIGNAFRYFINRPYFSPFITRSRQYHEL